jgi:hypothetical protein
MNDKGTKQPRRKSKQKAEAGGQNLRQSALICGYMRITLKKILSQRRRRQKIKPNWTKLRFFFYFFEMKRSDKWRVTCDEFEATAPQIRRTVFGEVEQIIDTKRWELVARDCDFLGFLILRFWFILRFLLRFYAIEQ